MNIQTIKMTDLESGLYIVSTPIGNLGDISDRGKGVLGMADYIICENPKHSLKLLNNLGIKKKLIALHDYNESIVIKRIEKYQHNSSIALISDAGSPLISDPGYNLVLDYIKKEIMITTIPGPSSVISALQLSGLPVHNFIFYGFVSKNKNSIEQLLDKVKKSELTSVLFISGNKLLNFLKLIIEKNIQNKISVCKEITKKNEQIFRGNAIKIIDLISVDIKLSKGEFVIVIGGSKKTIDSSVNDENKKQIKKLLTKYSLTEVVQIVHKLTNISKKEIYKTTLIIKDE